MNIEISTSETSTTAMQRDYIIRRLRLALSEHESRITQVQIWIVGILRADGNDAQYALINVKLDDGSLIACDGTDSDLRTAISHATRRVCLEVERNIDLQKKTTTGSISSTPSWHRDIAATDHRRDSI